MSAWLWLAALAGLLLALLAFVLTAPIELKAYAAYPAQRPLQLDVRWLHGLLVVEGLRLGGGDGEPEEAPEGAAEPEPSPTPEPETEGADADDGGRLEGTLDKGVRYLETRSEAEKKAKVALAAIRTEDLPLAVTRLLRDLVRAVHVDRIGLQLGFGFGSPAETGKVFGQLQAAFAWTHATDRIHVEIQPDFHAIGFEAGADAHIRARTWALLRPLIVFALAPPTLQAVKNARRAAKDA